MNKRVALLLAIVTGLPLLGYVGYHVFKRDIYTDPRPEDVPFLVTSLESLEFGGKPDFIYAAMKIIGKAKAYRDIRDAAKHRQSDKVYSAVAILGEGAVPQLVEILDNSTPNQRYFALDLLEHIGSRAKEAIPALTEHLCNTDNSIVIRVMSAKVLGAIGGRGVQGLMEAATHENHTVRFYAVKGLGNVQPRTNDVLTVLAESLKDDHVQVRWQAVLWIGEFGGKAARTVPALVRMLNDDDESVRLHAALVLKKIDPEAAAKAGVK